MMTIFVLIWIVAANWLAYTRGFYKFPKQQGNAAVLISNFQLLAVFGSYLLLTYVLTRFLLVYLLAAMRRSDPTLTSLPISVLTGLQFGVMAILLLVIQWIIFEKDRTVFRKIWKDRTHTPPSSPLVDLWYGVITWFLSFPLVTLLADFVDTVLKKLFQLQEYEQNAVKFVKIAQTSPLSLIFALLSVLVMAPLVEEFLFRGVLQTYFKKRLGAHAAILLSALLFALFHFSPGQGLGNVSLILSLLILGTFLGFLYERQGSLWAPIGLHIAFNSISAFRILFTPDVS